MDVVSANRSLVSLDCKRCGSMLDNVDKWNAAMSSVRNLSGHGRMNASGERGFGLLDGSCRPQEGGKTKRVFLDE